MKVKKIKASKLKTYLNPNKISYENSSLIPSQKISYNKFQPRALQAFRMALAIGGNHHNVYLSGESNLGRSYFAKKYFTEKAASLPTPPDQMYLYNFEDQDRPIAVSLPAGEGKKFKNIMSEVVPKIKEQLPIWFERESHVKAHDRITRIFQEDRDEKFTEMEILAQKRGFSLETDEHDTITLIPLIDGRILSDEEFERLAPDYRKKLRSAADDLLEDVTSILRKITKTEEGFIKDERKLHQDSAGELLKDLLSGVRKKFNKYDEIHDYINDLEDEILESIDLFMGKEPAPKLPIPALGAENGPIEDLFSRFEVNLFVDNSQLKGAPVIMADNPTLSNLLGSIERESELGALFTDFTLVRAGDIHKANHGFLIVYADDLLSQPNSWEGVLRALRTKEAKIEDPYDGEQIRTKTIEPEPIALDFRIIMIGSDETYELLLYNDDRFSKFFKLKAHMQLNAERNMANIRSFIDVIGSITQSEKTLPFNREALAAIVDYSTRQAEDQKKILLRFPLMRELMVEASALASLDKKKEVGLKQLEEAICMRDFRSNLYEEEYISEYNREVIKVSTSGSGVGRANGLSVTLFGDYEFGLPHRISCTVGVGHGGILDLEREASMGGPIHTKGMMIIKSYLVELFAKDKPIVLTGSLCFEQSYAGIEGDSASGAELAALISALSNVAIKFNYAFTGAVNQDGTIMAVGGVTRKVEGFFEVCKRKGLTGNQGVVLPADNVCNLMLKKEVVEAVENKEFNIYPVNTIEEALHILTGVNPGKRGKDNKFPKGTLYRKVDDRLLELAKLAGNYQKDNSL